MTVGAILLLFFVGTNGPATVQFPTLEECEAARPLVVQGYKDMSGQAPLARCISLPGAKGR